MPLLLGIDLGTSYLKVGLFDASGALRGLGRVAVEKDAPRPRWSELPAPRFWALLRDAISAALAQAGAQAAEIAGISYASQANSFVLLGAADEPLTPIVLWTDARAEPVAADLAAFSRTVAFARTTGFSGWDGGFAAAKCRWFQENAPETWRRTRRVLTLADYLSFALTGEAVGDASTAAFLGLYDLGRRRWWPEALALCGLAEARLSSPLPPGSPAGRTGPRAAELAGLPLGVPFAVGGLDHHVAALASGLGKLADVSISTGTVLAAITLVGAPEPRPACFHGPHFDGARFYRLAFDPNGAGQLEDYQRCQAPGSSLEQLLALAAVGGAGHGAEVLRLLRRIASAQRVLIGRVMGSAQASRIVATGGGSRSALWLQIKADTFGVPVMTPASPERACLGAAMLGSVAAGWHRSADEAAQAMLSPGPVFEPRTAP